MLQEIFIIKISVNKPPILEVFKFQNMIWNTNLTKCLILGYNLGDALAKGGNLYGRKIQEILSKKFF